MAKHADPAGPIDHSELVDEPIEAPPAQPADADTEVEAAESVGVDDNATEQSGRKRFSAIATATGLGIVIFIALGSLSAWQGYQAYEMRHAQQHRDRVIDTARQAAVNLTTIKFDEAERDIDRILQSATGKFHDDFLQRSQPFIEAVKQAQSTSQGTVTAAGITSQDSDQTDVLVAVSVKTSIPGAADQPPRSWRLRISVETRDNAAKISDVQFVI